MELSRVTWTVPLNLNPKYFVNAVSINLIYSIFLLGIQTYLHLCVLAMSMNVWMRPLLYGWLGGWTSFLIQICWLQSEELLLMILTIKCRCILMFILHCFDQVIESFLRDGQFPVSPPAPSSWTLDLFLLLRYIYRYFSWKFCNYCNTKWTVYILSCFFNVKYFCRKIKRINMNEFIGLLHENCYQQSYFEYTLLRLCGLSV